VVYSKVDESEEKDEDDSESIEVKTMAAERHSAKSQK
jgi:hypothetical protein